MKILVEVIEQSKQAPTGGEISTSKNCFQNCDQIYFHPWRADTSQPSLREMSLKVKCRPMPMSFHTHDFLASNLSISLLVSLSRISHWVFYKHCFIQSPIYFTSLSGASPWFCITTCNSCQVFSLGWFVYKMKSNVWIHLMRISTY